MLVKNSTSQKISHTRHRTAQKRQQKPRAHMSLMMTATSFFPAAEAAETAETVNIIGRATVVFNGKLRVRNAPSFAPETECGLMCKGDTVDVIDTAESDDGKPMWKTAEGNFISADEAHTAFVEV